MSDTARYNFNATIPWPLLDRHLRDCVEQVRTELESATDTMTLWKKQGELERLRKLLNLPGTLTIKFETEGQ